jgi:hypothetical protein
VTRVMAQRRLNIWLLSLHVRMPACSSSACGGVQDGLRRGAAGGVWGPCQGEPGSPVEVVADAVLALGAEAGAEVQGWFPAPLILDEEGPVELQETSERVADDGLGVEVGLWIGGVISREGGELVASVRTAGGVIGNTVGACERADAQGVGSGGDGGVVV